ncbi:interleukin-15 isoform X2 [Ambystoma mexicanum]|uniref:interleukin-15 isoform X2 n=1 Tax=Ambystoma mexicanum TaxID=8296 RepID=UPI0037E8629D
MTRPDYISAYYFKGDMKFIIHALTAETAVSVILINGCISICLSKTSTSTTYWDAFSHDLKKLKEEIVTSDAILYSGTTIKDKDHCRKVVLWCYLKEMEVIVKESFILGKEIETHHMDFLWSNSLLNKTLEEDNKKCLPCEQFPETTYENFIEDFTEFAQELESLQWSWD